MIYYVKELDEEGRICFYDTSTDTMGDLGKGEGVSAKKHGLNLNSWLKEWKGSSVFLGKFKNKENPVEVLYG